MRVDSLNLLKFNRKHGRLVIEIKCTRAYCALTYMSMFAYKSHTILLYYSIAYTLSISANNACITKCTYTDYAV